jgi:chromosome segregation ATPase
MGNLYTRIFGECNDCVDHLKTISYLQRNIESLKTIIKSHQETTDKIIEDLECKLQEVTAEKDDIQNEYEKQQIVYEAMEKNTRTLEQLVEATTRNPPLERKHSFFKRRKLD